MLIVKIMSVENLPDDDPRKSYSLFGNVVSVTFNRQEDESVIARAYIRDESRTAMVPGFVDHEVFWDVPANAYVMNASGKTISTFCSNPIEPQADHGRPAPRP